MKKGYDPKCRMKEITIFPGEYYATGGTELIVTVLGSCISVALTDPVNGICGMNHFMLPDDAADKHIFISQRGKRGIYAMELLIHEMIKLGSEKEFLRAKVFGGGSVLQSSCEYPVVPRENIQCIFEYLENENIPLAALDVGGLQARKLYFFTESNTVFVKRIETPAVNNITAIEERNYYVNLRSAGQVSAAAFSV